MYNIIYIIMRYNIYVTGPAKINHVSANYTKIYFRQYHQLRMCYPISIISEESPLNSTVVTEILLCLYNQFVSYCSIIL